MQPPIRTQSDGQGDRYSKDAARKSNRLEQPSPTRQEDKVATDLKWILEQFGHGPRKPVRYGVQDFDIDLQQAYAAIDQAKMAHATLSPELRKDYPTWQDLLNAIETGRLDHIPAPKTAEVAPEPTIGTPDKAEVPPTAEPVQERKL